MDEIVLREIEKLQENLQTIRKVAGWTTEELGNRIGVTKQTISNLENKNTRMTKTQYIAIRAILDYEIVNNSDSIALAKVVEVLLNTDDYEEAEELEQTCLSKTNVEEITELHKNTEKAQKKVEALTIAALAGGAILSPAVMVATSSWLAKVVSDKKK